MPIPSNGNPNDPINYPICAGPVQDAGCGRFNNQLGWVATDPKMPDINKKTQGTNNRTDPNLATITTGSNNTSFGEAWTTQQQIDALHQRIANLEYHDTTLFILVGVALFYLFMVILTRGKE